MANRWTREQQAAIYIKNANILVSASAGSGKTAVLVERVIQKVIHEGVNIDELLVVTFTNASAAELKEKLLVAIHKALDQNPNHLFLKKQLTYIHRASITTIHAFCLEMIRSYFPILNIDPGFKICDESQSNLFKNQVMEEVIEKEYEEYNQKESSKLYQILELFLGKEEFLIENIFKIYQYIQSFSYPISWLKEKVEEYNIQEEMDLYDTKFGKNIFDQAIEELELVVRRGTDVLEEIRENPDFEKFVICLEEELEIVKRVILESESSWDRLYQNLQEITFKRSPIYKGENIALKEKVASYRKDILKNTIERIKKSVYAPSDIILKDNKAAYEYVSYLCHLIEKFDEGYQKVKKEQGMIDFNDIEHLALQLLIKKNEAGELVFTDVARAMQKRFVEVYTDEYQDTSFVQEAILEAVSGSKNRFMVGDIKQSIYRFRQAMPEIFNEKYQKYSLVDLDQLEKDTFSQEKVILAKNFRSREKVIESINYIFEKIMSRESGDCEYSDLEVLKFGADRYPTLEDQDYRTEIVVVDLKEEKSNEYENENEKEENESEGAKYIHELKNFEMEAYCIANKINHLVNHFMVYHEKEGEFQKTQYKDIVILLRSMKDKGNILEKILKKLDIPAFSDASSSLFEGDEVKLILAFLKILDNPYQDIEMVSIMYSIIGKFTLDELVIIKEYDKKSFIYDTLYLVKNILENKENRTADETNLFSKIISFLKLLDKFQMNAKVYSIYDLLLHIYQETNFYYSFALEELSENKKANLDLLLELAKNTGYQSLSSYIRYIDHLKDKVDTSTSAAKMIGENENVVRIMTIHKSKGLEFPIVILADTMKKYNTMDQNNVITLHHQLGIGINIVKENLGITYPSVIKQAIRNKSIREMKAEEMRMLYVALTRAKEKLIIFATTKDYEKQKEQLFIMQKKNKIEGELVIKNNRYFDHILMALKLYEEENRKDIFYLNVLKIKEKHSMEEIISTFDLNKKKSFNDLEKKLSNLSKLLLQENFDVQEKIKEEIEKIKGQVEYQYPYLEEVKTASRISVSELKKKELEEISQKIKDEEEKEQEQIIFERPMSIRKEKRKESAARKGTLIHFILEHLDFSLETTEEVEHFIQQLVMKGRIKKEDRKDISVEAIVKFLNSSIGKELKEAKNIFREYEFLLKDVTFSRSVIQGIIDLFFITPDNRIILVDFKTDRTKTESVYQKRYRKQLLIYKEAIEKLLQKKVNQVYIYSFSLGKAIPVKGEKNEKL